MSDYRDPELEHMLGRLSGAYPDANTAYVAVTGRVRQVKRRRAFVASSAACIMLIGVGALAVRGGSDPQQVQLASESSESSNPTPTSTETSVKDDSTSSSEESTSSSEESTSSTDAPTTSADSVSPVTAPSVNTASKTTGGSGSTSSTSSNSGSSGSNSSSSSSQATVTVPAGQSTFESAGGKVVVNVTDGALSLVTTTPADGFTTNVKHDRSDRVEVEFSDGSTTWRIRIDLVNGVAVVQTTQH
jgi:cytoskeletal protein RodZ